MIQWLLGCVFLLAAAPVLAAPSLSVKKPVHDFGTITQGEKVEHTFTVRNRGNEPLTIHQIRSSCGCTAASLSAKTISPGRSGEVRVTFDSSNFYGQVTKTVHLDSNDPRNPSAVLTMEGKIAEIIVPSPRTLNLGLLKAGTRKEVVVTLENRGERPFTITSVQAQSPQEAIVGKVREGKVNPGRSGEITVVVTAPREGSFLSGNLTIQTNHPQKREVVVPVFATITP